MTSEQSSIRVPGQRSILSTFLRSSNRSTDCKEDGLFKSPNKEARVSLSHFLERKLHKPSFLPKSVQGKDRPFLSPVGGGDMSGSHRGESGIKRKRGAEVNCVLDFALEQLKHTTKHGHDRIHSSAIGEPKISDTDDEQTLRSRRNLYQGLDKKQPAGKLLVVLGDARQQKQKRKEDGFIADKKQKALYNHYANGGGWWDCSMEGVDSEEVGCNEVWEGVGYTAVGGLEWH